MSHRRKPRRSKMDQQLITLEQTESANVTEFSFSQSAVMEAGNLAKKLTPHRVEEIEEMIRQRWDSAEETTNLVTQEILRSERQCKTADSGAGQKGGHWNTEVLTPDHEHNDGQDKAH